MGGPYTSQVQNESSACPLCESTATTVKWPGTQDWATSSDQAFLCTSTTRERPEILLCPDCGHIFSNPSHWPEDLGHEYEVLEDTDYLSMLDIKRRTFSRAADVLTAFVRAPASVLEIGAYTGLFLDECRRRGFAVCGIEPSRWGAQLARSRGLDVRDGTAERLLNDESLGTFDAVVSWDVLEHVRDPRQFVRLAAAHVKPGGFLIVSTLDRTNWFARLMGKRWPWLIPMHLHYFDQKSVIDMAAAEGCEFRRTRAHVHFTSAGYALKRLVNHGDSVGVRDTSSTLEKIVFPVGFGDVRLFVFQKSRESA